MRAINAAVGRESGSITLPKIDYAKPGMFGAHSIEGATTVEEVQLLALDQYLRTNRCRLMKIDVEGMEGQVILGARTFIEQHKPILYVENDRKEKSPSLIRTFLHMGYRLYWHLSTLTRDDIFFRRRQGFHHQHDLHKHGLRPGNIDRRRHGCPADPEPRRLVAGSGAAGLEPFKNMLKCSSR